MMTNNYQGLELDEFLFYFEEESFLWHAVSRYDYEAAIKDENLKVNTLTATSMEELLFFITNPNRAIN